MIDTSHPGLPCSTSVPFGAWCPSRLILNVTIPNERSSRVRSSELTSNNLVLYSPALQFPQLDIEVDPNLLNFPSGQ